ncbi:MAG: hypothetical protein P8L44_17760 [Opitutales bacterium]|nr:hypothetical protein [Opitutales bacterium]
MKRTNRFFLFLLLTIGLQAPAWSMHNHYRLSDIVDRFEDADPAVQYEARRELAAYVADASAPSNKDGAENVTKELLGYLTDREVHREAKKYILRDLARVGTESAAERMYRIVMGRDEEMAELARQALSQIPGQKATDYIKRAVDRTRDDAKRQLNIRALANRNDPGMLNYFIEGLSSSDDVMAKESVYALERQGTPRAGHALQDAYNRKPSKAILLDLERAVVAQVVTDDSTLLKIATAGVSSANKNAGLTRLVESGHGNSNTLLESAITGPDVRLRSTAIRLALENGKPALVESQGKNFTVNDWLIVLAELDAFDRVVAENLAQQALKHSDISVRATGLRALGTYGSAKTANMILLYLNDKDKELQMAAAYAIARASDSYMTGRVNRLLNSEVEEEIILGLQVLAHRHQDNAKSKLFKFINGEDPILMREALKVLSTVADEEDLYKLYIALRRGSEEKQKMVIGLLKKVVPEVGSLDFQTKVKAL